MEGQNPLNLKNQSKPLLWKDLVRDSLLDFPKRPSWSFKHSKERGKHEL
jgi:hypothetical protein